MSLHTPASAVPTGARRISLAMLAARDLADRFTGVATGTAKPFGYLATFQEAVPYLGLPSQAFMLVAWLVKQTMPCDWEVGSRPIAWPSARHQQEYLGLSSARVKALNRALFEAGIFVIRDNDQGKRYGRRGQDKRIIEAYGFDLSPLAQRAEEFIRIATEAKAKRDRMKALRQRITIARRGVRQAGELIAALDKPLPAGWSNLVLETAELVRAGRASVLPDDLSVITLAVESRKLQAEQWLKAMSEPVEMDPVGLVNEPHIIITNLNSESSDTVTAAEGGSGASAASCAAPKSQDRRARQGNPGIHHPEQLLELFPRLEQYITAREPGWPEIVNAAGGALRYELAVSATLWGEACRVMGREGAALALAIVSTKPDGHFTRGPGGYFGGMVRRAEKGELYLERTLWALRIEKMRRPPSRAMN
jgi:replication initiation protein RepC